MFRYTISSITIIIAIISLIAIQQASALQCWSCNNAKDSFCQQTWDSSNVTVKNQPYNYMKCPDGVCLKLVVRDGDGKPIRVERSCKDNEKYAQATCLEAEGSNLKAGNSKHEVECLTCGDDGCNFAVQNGPMTLLIALPIAIAKIFLF